MRSRIDDCPLCRAEKLTRWYYEDDICWVADCVTCKVPMIVLKRHATIPVKEELVHLHLIAGWLKLSGNWDEGMKAVPDHFHVHLR